MSMLPRYFVRGHGWESCLLRGLLLIGLYFAASASSYSQQYTLRDQAEVKYLALLTLAEYESTLNLISNSNVPESVLRDAIQNAYNNPNGQIFYSPEVRIENNIRPSGLSAPEKTAGSVADYIREFSTMYVKSDMETVDFYDFQVSNLKFKDHLYVRVKYTAHFRGRHHEDAAPYTPVDRVAEIRVEKKDNRWVTSIAGISYYNAALPILSAEADVKLNTAVDDDGTFAARIRELIQNQQTAQLAHVHKADGWKAYDDKRFKEISQLAAQAEDIRDYAKARHFYTQALYIRPREAAVEASLAKLDKLTAQNEQLQKKYHAGKYMDAIREYSKAISNETDNADHYLGRAKCYEQLNELQSAIKDYSEAIKLDGNFVDALHNRAILYVRTDQSQKALQDYDQIIQNLQDATAYYAERAKVKLNTGDTKGALRDYEALIKLNPEKAAHYYEKGLVQRQQKQFEQAVESFTTAIEKDSLFANAYYSRGLAYVDNQSVNLAAIDFDRARKIGLEKEQLTAIDDIAFEYISTGDEAMRKANYKNALANFIKAVLLSPEDEWAWMKKGDAHYALLDYENAVQSYTKALELEKLSLASYKRGQAYRKLNNETAAKADFKLFASVGKKVIAQVEKKIQNPQYAYSPQQFAEEISDAWYILGDAQRLSEQYNDAISSLDTAIKINKGHSKALYARAAVWYALQKYKKAIKDVQESIGWGVQDGLSAYLLLGDAYQANGQCDYAIGVYSYIIDSVDQKFDPAYRQRAQCFKNIKQYQLALQDIRMALSLNEAAKRDVGLITSKGLMELYELKYQEASQSFDQALSISENDAWALYGKACVLASQNKVEESLSLYRKAFQTRKIEWASIKDDPIIQHVSKQKPFMDLFQSTFRL